MTDATFNVLVIGAGAIGAFYDSPESENMLTHGHAFSAHPGFHLIGFVDCDLERARSAAALWCCKAFGSIEEAFQQEAVDVVCVAVPAEMHYPILKAISGYPLKAVFTEKPLTKTVAEAKEIVSIFAENQVPVCVNYRRCFVPEFEALRDKIKAGNFGKYMTGSGCYGKGFLHNGSHLINLLGYLVGDIKQHRILSQESDCFADDPSISLVVGFDADRLFTMLHVNCNHYTVFEADLFFERGRVRITDTGFRIQYQKTVDSDIFKGYRFLAVSEDLGTSLGRSLYHSADNIYEHLTVGRPLKCTLQDAFMTMLVCNKVQGDLSQA
ncbi:Gfo/Idh/MocA family protein [Geobacter sp.]|uniref:Gfo/Idh/MocA family protein n=1 Tax=Geobacter sp. TaxID=46610 RepID=UPI0027BA7475|nr:Gfo/Idh/MocA family oxidoreductase [Geobacter sp.]